MTIKTLLTITLSAAILLPGCTLTAMELKDRSMEFIFGKDVNMTEKSYAAADYLVQQASNNLKHHQLTKVEPLSSLDAPKLTAPLATLIPEQIGQRFVQLGYAMDLSAVADKTDSSFYDAANSAAENILTGTYSQDDKGIHVNLRMKKADTGRVFSTFAYLIPSNRTTRELAEPEAQIMSIDSSWGE